MSFFADIPAPANCKLYVGNLGNEGTKEELEKAFGHYGPLHEVWLARNPPGFAFVTFQESRHAKAALKDLNGQQICGRRVRVEWARKCNSRMHFQFPLGGHAARRQFCAAMKSSNLSVFINGQRYL